MSDEPAREIEVEILPPGAIPRARSTSAPGSDNVFGRTETVGAQAAGTDSKPQFEDPFFALIARLMDSAFVIPGTNIRFGLDPIIGLLPGIGDGATALTSLMLLLKAVGHGVPKIVLARMALNIVLNTSLGAVPIFGDAFSFYFKSNDRNYELLRKHAGDPNASTKGEWTFVIALLGGLGLVLVLTIIGYAAVFGAIVKLISDQ
jgi:Domain of unknown function (DUF4112)